MVGDIYKIAPIVTTIMREDILFVDKISYRYSVRKSEGFFSFSELLVKHYGSAELYGTRRNGTLFARQARTVNYSELVSVLTSKDAALFEENKWIWDGNFRFLDNKEKIGLGGHLNNI